ncbi:MAG: AI-2E family transporter [Bdellovibrionota bacterium]
MENPLPAPRLLMTSAFLVVAIWGLRQSAPFFVPICISALLAFLMVPVLRALKRIHFPEWLAVILTALLILLPFAGLAAIAVRQIQQLVHDSPAILAAAKREVAALVLSPLGKRLHLSSVLDVNQLSQKVAQVAGRGVEVLLAGASVFLSAGSQLLLALLFSIVMLASRSQLRRSVSAILAQWKSVNTPLMLNKVTTLIEQFLLARLLVLLIIGALATGVLTAFGMPFSLLMGALLGLMTLVPAVGFLIGVTPPMIVYPATGHSFWATVALFASLLAVNILENNFLTPKMVGGRLNLNMLATFIGFFAGAQIWGVWGMFLSIPILGILRIVFSASPRMQPWGDLLSERPDPELTRSLRLPAEPKKETRAA